MSRPVTDVRPLVIGAAWLRDTFECLAPADWDADRVRVELFAQYEFQAAGWKQTKMFLEGVGLPRDDGSQCWRVRRS